MALIKCKECEREISSGVKACPHCGAKPAKKTSVVTWLVGGFFAFAIVMGIASNQERAAAKAARTPEQVAADAKKELAFQATVSFGKALKSRLRDPSSVEWEAIAANDDASVICMQYRAKNGFGGFSREIMVLARGATSSEQKAWTKNCTKGMTDFSHASIVI